MFDLDNIKKTYFKMALPVVFGMVITLVYNLADTWFISKTGNVALIAGVSLCSPIFTTLMALGNIFGQGGSSLISRLLGKQDSKSSQRVSSFCFFISIITGLLVMITMLIFEKQILSILGADNTTIFYARDYYIIMAIGAPIVVLNFIHTNFIRCEGMSLESMAGSLIGTILNIILDPILIFSMNMGARGAAVATIIGYIVSDLYFLILVLKKSTNISVDIKKCKVGGEELWQILGVGFTAAITNLMSSLCVIIVNRFLLDYGENYIASMGMVLRVNMIAQLILVGFTFGGVPIYGYLFGSNNKEKLNELIKFCITFLGSLAIIISGILFLFANPIMSVFTNNQELLGICTNMLKWQVAGTIFVSVVLYVTVLFQATGKVVQAFIMSISRQGLVFIIAIVVLTHLFGYKGILISQLTSDFVSAVIGIGLYALTFAKNKSIPNE